MSGFRKTKQNALILNIINNSNEHLSAFEVYQKCLKTIDNISLGTVYRNLNNLVDNHKIRKIVSLDGKEHFDNLIVNHNHFICLKCMQISDVSSMVDIPLKSEFGRIIDYEIIYRGICHNCDREDK